MIVYCDIAGRNTSLHLVEPSLSIYFSSRKPTTATELTEESPPVYSKSYKKSDGGISLSFVYVPCEKSMANLKLITNLIVSPDTSTLNGKLLTDWTAESRSFWFETAMK